MTDYEVRGSIVRAGLKLITSGLISRTWGNISCRVNENTMLITPSGRDYLSLTPEDIVEVKISDCSYSGNNKPSVEKNVHAAVYRNFPEVNFVIHTHQTNASVTGSLGLETLNIKGDYSYLSGEVPCAKYALPGTKSLAQNVEAVFTRMKGNAILMKHHGAVCFGKDQDAAFHTAEQLEVACGAFVEDYYMEKSNEKCFNVDCMRKFALKKTKGSEYVNQNHTKLQYSSERTPDGFMLTRDNGACIEVEYDQIKEGMPEDARIHNQIYKRYKDANYIRLSTEPNTIAVSRHKMNIRPLLDDFAQIAGTFVLTVERDPGKIAAALRKSSAALVWGEGALSIGNSKDEVAAIAMILEKECKTHIAAALFNNVKPLSRLDCLLMRLNYKLKYSKEKNKKSRECKETFIMENRNISPYRWLIVLAILPAIISTEIMWLTLAPISTAAEKFYGVGSIGVSMFPLSYLIMFIIFAIPSSFVIDKYGFRKSLIIGAVLTAVFGTTRALFADNFAIALGSQFLIAIGQPFILNISTKVPANWFPVDERATATGILTMAQYIGFMIPMIVSPALVISEGIPGVFRIYAIIAVGSLLIAILFTREKPAIAPPGPITQREDMSFGSMKKLFGNSQFVFIGMISFLAIGVFNTILSLTETILSPQGFNSTQAGILGATFTVAGVLGAVIVPALSDKLRKRKPIFLGVSFLMIPLYTLLFFQGGFMKTGIIAGLSGFLVMGVAPILFQHGSEAAYPVQEGTSLAMMILLGNIAGFIFIYIFEAMRQISNSNDVPKLMLIGVTIIEFCIFLFVKEADHFSKKMTK